MQLLKPQPLRFLAHSVVIQTNAFFTKQRAHFRNRSFLLSKGEAVRLHWQLRKYRGKNITRTDSGEYEEVKTSQAINFSQND